MFWSRGIKRLFITAFKDLTRNVWLNVATIIIIVIALFTIAVGLTIDTIGKYAVAMFKDKIDISIHFQDEASEEKILGLKTDLEALTEVKSVNYISKEQALLNFMESHKDDKHINQSIEVLGDNPLFAVLNIKTNSLEQYETVDDYISNNKNYEDIIRKIDYKENKNIINKMSGVLQNAQNGINILIVLFVIISVLIAFNTIRLAMYAHKIEIEIMRLVGASNWYIKLPFVIEGAVFGVMGSVVTLILCYALVVWGSADLERMLPGFYLQDYFMNNVLMFWGILLSVGVGMGVVSSLIAIRRYIK